jgi:hypothetical protein
MRRYHGRPLASMLHAGVRLRNLTGPAPCQLFEEVDQPLAARQVTQLAQRLHLDLTNAFASDPESLASPPLASVDGVDETEAKLQNTTFARSQRVGRPRPRCAAWSVTPPPTARSLPCPRRSRRAEHPPPPRSGWTVKGCLEIVSTSRNFSGDPHLLRDLLVVGLAAQLLKQTPRDTDELADQLHHVHGDADGLGLVVQSPPNCLADPPGRVSRELSTFRSASRSPWRHTAAARLYAPTSIPTARLIRTSCVGCDPWGPRLASPPRGLMLHRRSLPSDPNHRSRTKHEGRSLGAPVIAG